MNPPGNDVAGPPAGRALPPMKPAAAVRCLALLIVPITAACELTEVTLAEPVDLVVAEIILRTDEAQQRAFLHRTAGTSAAAAVAGATIEVSDAAGIVMTFEEAPLEHCLDEPAAIGTCYRSMNERRPIRPDITYTLRIILADGGVITGSTHVPGAFRLVRPAQALCRLAPDQRIEVTWTRSAGAWVYLTESRLGGLRDALRPSGIELDDDPVRFLGVSVSAEDTTLSFPDELGVFDRFDPDLTEALVAIQGGLPPDVDAELVVAAADRNYVNWVRGGQFNPSGNVRVPSLAGDGTGVFGSIAVNRTMMLTSSVALPPCQ